jgi:formylglycine-generating enzyme required for sulfatase activity
MPSHDVTLSAFKMDLHEVTTVQYATFLRRAGGGGHYAPSMPIAAGPTSQDFAALQGTESIAMYDVTWFDARAYCLWLGGDLPTEAQWEYAAKETTGRVYPWGTTGPSCSIVSFFTGDVTCNSGPLAVGSYDAGSTPEGAEDMAGNVAEWTLDAYDVYPSDPQTDPTGPTMPMYGADAAAVLRVVRGGGFHDIALSLRTTNRWGADAALRSKGVGFRCAYH